MRESGPVEGVLLAAALLGMALGAAGVLKLVRGVEGSRRATTWAFRLVAGGGAAVVLLGVTQAAFFDGDLGPMPFLLIPAGIALLAGFLMLGVAVLRSRVLPTPVSVTFLVATLLMAGFNEQTHAVLLGLPMGVAWIALGWTLWSGAARPDAAPTAG